MKVTVLSGGVGGARFTRGLLALLRDRLPDGAGGTTAQVTDATPGSFGAHVADRGDQSEIARQLKNTVGDAVAKAAAKDSPRKPKAIAWDPSWERYAGLYRGTFGDSHVVLLNQRLVIISPTASNLDNPITLAPLGGGRFRYSAPTGGGPVGEIVRFVEENGRVVRMITGDSYVDRVQ